MGKKRKRGRDGEGNEIKRVPVGFVPLDCFFIPVPIPHMFDVCLLLRFKV